MSPRPGLPPHRRAETLPASRVAHGIRHAARCPGSASGRRPAGGRAASACPSPTDEARACARTMTISWPTVEQDLGAPSAGRHPRGPAMRSPEVSFPCADSVSAPSQARMDHMCVTSGWKRNATERPIRSYRAPGEGTAP